jgi:hypothetical protein
MDEREKDKQIGRKGKLSQTMKRETSQRIK